MQMECSNEVKCKYVKLGCIKNVVYIALKCSMCSAAIRCITVSWHRCYMAGTSTIYHWERESHLALGAQPVKVVCHDYFVLSLGASAGCCCDAMALSLQLDALVTSTCKAHINVILLLCYLYIKNSH